jgi:hypothetical protein
MQEEMGQEVLWEPARSYTFLSELHNSTPGTLRNLR